MYDIVIAVSSMHVEFYESSNDDRVVTEFIALLARSSPLHRQHVLDTVQQAAAVAAASRLHHCGAELIAVRPTGSIAAYFVLKSLSAVHEVDTLYDSGQLGVILEHIFTCLLKSNQLVRIKTLTWTVSDFNNCVRYFLQNISKQISYILTVFFRKRICYTVAVLVT